MSDSETTALDALRVAILVPRREGFSDRDALWAFCRRWWQATFPDLRIFEGHHDHGLFNRSAAINAAARLAGDWDVALIIDADVLAHPPNVRQAIALAHETGKLVVAFDVRHNLNRAGSKRIMAGESGSWRRYIERDYRDQHSACIAVSRRLFDEIGGFDESFRGWGQEDTAFAIACETFAGPRINLPGEVWHLWHATQPEGRRGTPSANANRARIERYKAAWGDRDAVRAVILDQTPDLNLPGIPRILHRVVPEHTLDVAEQWWAQWGALNPGWRQMTWRDPLDAEQFPLTRHAWRSVKAGAQLADLVRLEVLLNYGGVYVDQDMQPLRSIEPLRAVQGFAAYEDENVVPNAILGAAPNHPAIKQCLELALRRYRQSVWAAGPGVTTAVLVNRDDFLILPPGAFYAVHYRDPDRDAKMRAHQPPWAFALHHYWASWTNEPHLPTETAA